VLKANRKEERKNQHMTILVQIGLLLCSAGLAAGRCEGDGCAASLFWWELFIIIFCLIFAGFCCSACYVHRHRVIYYVYPARRPPGTGATNAAGTAIPMAGTQASLPGGTGIPTGVPVQVVVVEEDDDD